MAPSLPRCSLSLSFSSTFVFFFLVILSLCHSFTIYSIPFSNASKVSPPLSNLTRVRAETRKRGATWQKRFEAWKGSRLHASASLLRTTRLRHCQLESLIGRGLCKIDRECIVESFNFYRLFWRKRLASIRTFWISVLDTGYFE